jgi:Ice-binding-like/Bacterial Ig-like domain
MRMRAAFFCTAEAASNLTGLHMKNFESSSPCRTWSMALLLSAVAVVTAGCGGGGGGRDPILGAGGATVVVPPFAGPTVSSNVPATEATNVPVNTNVTATFSKDMDPSTINAANLTLTCAAPCVSPAVSPAYNVATRTATFNPATPTGVLLANTRYTATVSNGAKDTVGLALASNFVWAFTTAVDTTPPTVTAVNPDDAVPGSNACLTKVVNATFSKPMNQSTISTASFTVQPSGPPLGTALGGVVAYDVSTRVATFTATAPLVAGNYTATITTAVKDLSGNALAAPGKVWTFTATGIACAPPLAPSILASAQPFGTFGGSAGMTNKGIQTRINGAGGTTADIGTIATTTSTITGFEDSAHDVYTVVPGVNQGLVSGKIYSCTTSTTGPTNPTNGVNPASCTTATQARLDAQTAYLSLAARPVSGPGLAANLAGLTVAPGVYKAPSGSFLIEGGDLTLDAQGDATAVWVFQMASTLTVGGPGAEAPQSVILTGGALAKNVYWQVGTAATINAGGGGTMVGTIISQAGAAFSTAGNVIPVALNGRALSLDASVTLVNTVVTVPAP